MDRNLYLRNFHSIPPYQRVKLEAAIANFYVTVNRPNKLALFAYSVLKEYLDKFLSQGLVQLPGGEIAISSYLRRTANNIELSNGALKNTKLIYELLSSQQQGNESGSPPMLVHIMKVLCLFAAFNNEFDLAAEVVIQIMDRSYKWFSWATQKYLLNKFYAFSNARILKKIRIKQRLSSNKSSVDGFYNRDVIYSPIFGGLIIKSLKVSCLQLSSEVCIGHDTRSTKLSSDILESKYITSVDEMFYLDIVIENQFPFDIFLEKIDVNTEEGEIRVLAAKSNISLFSSNRIQIPIITLKPGVLILKECVFVLLFGGLECIVPIVDAGYHRRDQIRVCVTPLSPLLTFKWGQIDAYEKLTIMEGEVKRIKLIVENIGNAPAIVTHKFCEDVIDKDLPRTRGNSVHTLLRKTFVSISKSPAESRGATCFSDVESFLVKGSQDQNSEFEIPTHESIALDVHILGVEGPIQGDIHLIYSQPASGGALPHYRVLKIHLSAEVKQIFELRDLSIINFDYTASANEYNREAVECLQNRSIHGGAEEDYQCKYVMILFYIRNLQDQGYDITLKVDDGKFFSFRR